MNSKKKMQQEIIAYILLIVGSALFAIGDVMFVNPYLMAPGGTYGLSNVLNTVWPWKISLYAICMDIPLLLVGTWILGPKFGIKTIISTALIFAFTYILDVFTCNSHDNIILHSILLFLRCRFINETNRFIFIINYLLKIISPLSLSAYSLMTYSPFCT